MLRLFEVQWYVGVPEYAHYALLELERELSKYSHVDIKRIRTTREERSTIAMLALVADVEEYA